MAAHVSRNNPQGVEPPRGTAVFVDRDGVINEERRAYVTRWSEFRFLPGALDALVALSQTGQRVLVITNQSAIHRGLATHADVRRLHRRMVAAVTAAGGRIDGIYVCPHRPDEGCDCRKPRPGLLLRAAAQHRLDLARCYLIGDKLTDIEAGLAVGCRCILVRTGLDDTAEFDRPETGPHAFRCFGDIRTAVDHILQSAALDARLRDAAASAAQGPRAAPARPLRT